ncbi:radical SAM protein [Kitasatospora sp. NPDC048407]|uniref:radical SAM protein n=1 Tax=Kitasatospora sp. NPDC048407 TaxID=3364051 RepID=UPI0037136347
MTAIMERPQSMALIVPESVELELTNKCQLNCGHCFNDSGPHQSHGTMTLDDWMKVVAECAELGVTVVQLIGGEPTAFPGWRDLVDHALSLGLEVEVFSNLYHLTETAWETVTRPGVRLATSYYSINAGEHDRVTRLPGSHRRTRANIVTALNRGIPLRVGIVRCHDEQFVEQARQELLALGVHHITVDDARGIGRAGNGQAPTMDALCGNCARGRVAILPDGTVAPCVIGRWLGKENVKDAGGLRRILSGPAWAQIAAGIPPKRSTVTGACTPNDSNDCDPSNTPACAPKYDVAPGPTTLSHCPPNDSQSCAPTEPACNPQFGL